MVSTAKYFGHTFLDFRRTQKPEELINALLLDTDDDCIYPKCIPLEKLSVESSLFWEALIVYFQQDDRRSVFLEPIIPELSLFCGYVQKYNDTLNSEEKEPWETLISQNVLFCLIEILLTFDYGDEIGRQNLRALVIHLLTTNPCNENIIKSLVKICEKLITNSDDRLQVYVDVIRSLVDQDSLESALNFSDPNVIESLEKDPNLKVQVSSLKLKLYELKEEESKFVKTKDYPKLSQISEQISLYHEQLANLVRPLMTLPGSNSLQQKRITKELQIKALQLAFHGVCSRNVTKLNPAMCQLYTDFIRLKIESNEMEVRNLALKCGATFSLLYEQLAKDVFTALNKQFFDHHIIDVWTTSVGAMFQLIVRYGLSYFDEDSSGHDFVEEKQKEKSKKSRTLYNTMEYLEDPEDDSNFENGKVTIKGLIYLFGHFMDTCDDIHLMSALVDGFGLLILHGLYTDENLVSRLILLYFNPATEPEVNQILSIFFETLIHQKKQECLETALIQTLTKIIEASSESSLHEVKIETVLNFIINATFPVYCKPGINIHNNMGISLLKWMNTNATNRELLRTVSKEILVLEISDDPQIRKTLVELTDELLDMPMDSRTEKNLKSFKEIMQGNHPVEIEFSSVAPANRIDGELSEDAAYDDPKNLSDNESANINDDDNSNDLADDDSSLNNSECGDNSKDKSKSQCSVASEPQNPVTESTTTEKEIENVTKSVENGNTSGRKRLSTSQESSEEIPSPTKIRYDTVSEDNASSPTQIEVRVSVHNRPGNVNENTSPGREDRRARVRQHIISQQMQNSPDIILATPPTDSAAKRRREPKKTVARILSTNPPTVASGKRKISSLETSQRKGDSEEKSPKTKKSKLKVFSENKDKEKDELEKEKVSNAQSKNINEKLSTIERSTRRKRVAALNTSMNRESDDKDNRKSSQKSKNLKSNGPIKKPVASLIPTRLNRRADPKLQGKITNSKSVDPKQPPKSNKVTTSSTASATKQTSNRSVSTKLSARKNTPNVSPARTPTRKALFTNDSPSRRLLSTSEPPVRKANSKVDKKVTSARKQKETTSKMSISLTNLDSSSYRTRRGLTKQFMVNNVITRKRASIDGVKLLEKIDTLMTVRRKN